MATPDIHNFFERFLQIYGGQGGSTASARSEPRDRSSQPAYSAPANAYGSEDAYEPTGGVLRGWSSRPPAAPSWARALAGPNWTSVDLREPRLGGRRGGRPFPPMPGGLGEVVEVPNPHLERFIPQSTHDFWNALALGSQILRGQLRGDEQSSGAIEGEEGASSSPAPGGRPPYRPGSQPPWYVGPPLLEEKGKRQSVSDESEPRTAQELDSNFRKLERVELAKDYGALTLPPAAAGKIPRVESPRLAPEHEAPDNSLRKDVSSGGGNCGNGQDDEGREPDKNAYCDARKDIEIERCDERWLRRRKWPNVKLCMDRAGIRRDQCQRNGGMPPLWERPEWGIDDEDQIKRDKGSAERRERKRDALKGRRKK